LYRRKVGDSGMKKVKTRAVIGMIGAKRAIWCQRRIIPREYERRQPKHLNTEKF